MAKYFVPSERFKEDRVHHLKPSKRPHAKIVDPPHPDQKLKRFSWEDPEETRRAG